MEYLSLEVNEDGKFDIPEENCFIENEVVFLKNHLKLKVVIGFALLKKGFVY